jgi:malonyl-CoA/methylmalonyl-CoA synthetase
MAREHAHFSAVDPADWVECAARDQPHRPFLETAEGRQLNYASLREQSGRFSAALMRRGVVPGDRVAVQVDKSVEGVLLYVACLRMGAVFVPINPANTPNEVDYFLRDSNPRVAVIRPADYALLEPHAVRAGIPHIETLGDQGEGSLLALVRQCAEDPGMPRRHGADALAAIVYTSGTTGRAKGAMQSHNALAASCAQIRTAWHWRDDDVLCVALPLFHVHGLHVAMQTTLAVGATVVVERRFDAQKMRETLLREKATMFFGVPTMYVRLLERVDDLPELRLWVAGSAALSAETWNAFKTKFGQEILERYGATETCMCLTNRFRGPYHPGAVGIPFPGIRTRVIDPATQADVADGEVGELLINGPNVFSGYYKNPQATRDAFVLDADGGRWFRSGDLVRFDPAIRSFAVVGRLKELIITGGFNVYPREIEEEIEALPGIKECAVIGLADPARGEVPYAFVAVEDAAAFDGEALLLGLRERIASFKIPKGIEVLDAIPRNAMGKLDKPTLRAMMAERPVKA